MATFTPVDHDPFAAESAPSAPAAQKYTPVDHDPFASQTPPPSFMSNVGTGLMDKIYGGLQMGGTAEMAQPGAPQEVYTQSTEAMRKKLEDREKTIKTEGGGGAGRTVGNILGDFTVTAPLLMIPGAPEASLIGRIGEGMAQGAAGGGISGALQPGTSRNVGAEKAGQILTGAAGGAVGGGAVGGVLGAVERNALPIGNRAIDAITSSLNRNAKAGGPSAADAIAAVGKANKGGTPMSLLDVGGAPTRALGGSVTRKTPDALAVGEQFMDGRAKGAAGRVDRGVTDLVHGGPSAYQTDQVLQAAQIANASPLYQKAETLQNVWSPRLQQFLDDPELIAGLKEGARLERIASLAENRPFDPTQMGIQLDAEGNVKLIRVPNLRVLDMGKRGLDARIAAERQPDGRMSTLGRELNKLRRSYVKEIDAMDTEGIYKSARDAWAGPAASRDAVEFGKSIFRHPEREAAASEFSEMSPANQEFARIGAAQELRDRIMKSGIDGRQRRDILNTEYMREQLRPIFKSDSDYDKFIKVLSDEDLMRFVHGDVLKGSQTALRREIDESGPDLVGAQHAMGLAHSTAKMNWVGMAHHGMQLSKDRLSRPNHELNEEIAKRLFSGAPDMTKAAVASPSRGYPAAATGMGDALGDAVIGMLGLR